jgi:hypothetical protein
MPPKYRPPAVSFNRHDLLLVLGLTTQIIGVSWWASGINATVAKHEEAIRVASPDRLARLEEGFKVWKETVNVDLAEIKGLLRRPMRLGASELPSSPTPLVKAEPKAAVHLHAARRYGPRTVQPHCSGLLCSWL